MTERSFAPSSRAPGIATLSRLFPSSKINRVVSIIGLLVASGVAIFAVFFVTSLRDSEVKAIREQLQIPVEAMTHEVQQIAKNADLSLQAVQAAMKTHDSLIDQDAGLRQLLLARVYARTAARKIEIYDAAGKLVVSSDADPPIAVSVADYGFFKRQLAARSNQVIVSGLVPDPIDGQPKIIMSRPIIDPNGAVGGVVAVYIDSDYLQRTFDALHMPRGSAIVVVQRERPAARAKSRDEARRRHPQR